METDNCSSRLGPTIPELNFTLAFDTMEHDDPFSVEFHFTVKKTIRARVKYWLFCKFFPFKITKWEG